MLSLKSSDPERDPVPPGVNCIVTVHEAPEISVVAAAQVPPETTANSLFPPTGSVAKVALTPTRRSFVIVNVCVDPATPTTELPKAELEPDCTVTPPSRTSTR